MEKNEYIRRVIFVLLLTFIVFVSLLGMKVLKNKDSHAVDKSDFVTSGSCGNSVTWEYIDGVLTISGSGEMWDYPYSSGGVPWKSFDGEIKSIIINSGVTRINKDAFWQCGSLTTISIPDSVTSIGRDAFLGCRNLTDVFYSGMREQRGRIDIYYMGNACLTNATWHYIGTMLSVEADVSTAAPGSEITFKVSVASSVPFTGIGFDLDIPEGLTYVAGSGRVLSGVKDELGFAEADFTELTKRGTFDNEIPYAKSDEIALVEFKCRADSDCEVGEYTVSIINADVTGEDFNSVDFTTWGKKINVTFPTGTVTLTDKTTASVNAGGNVILTPAFVPDTATNKDIVWSSSDESIAIVDDNGNVTGLKNGTVTIIATTGDGGYTASCTVTVNCSHTHTTRHNALESTCMVQGTGEYVSCDECGEITSGSDEKLPLKNHTMTKHDRVEPDHFTAGSIEYYICGECEKLFSDIEGKNEIEQADTAIFPIPHTYSDTWSYDADGHWHECSCGDIEDKKTAHTLGDWIIDVKATFTEKGSKHKECVVCKKVMVTEEIAVLIEYEFIEGANSTWQPGKGTISFRPNADRDKFEGVRVDGSMIAGNDYDVSKGIVGQPGFVIIMKEDYLKKLPEGIHKITVIISDGEANTNFEVKKAEEPGNPDVTKPDNPDATKPDNTDVAKPTIPDTEQPATPDIPDTIQPEIPQTGDVTGFKPLVAMLLISAGMFIAFVVIHGITFPKNEKVE